MRFDFLIRMLVVRVSSSWFARKMFVRVLSCNFVPCRRIQVFRDFTIDATSRIHCVLRYVIIGCRDHLIMCPRLASVAWHNSALIVKNYEIMSILNLNGLEYCSSFFRTRHIYKSLGRCITTSQVVFFCLLFKVLYTSVVFLHL